MAQKKAPKKTQSKAGTHTKSAKPIKSASKPAAKVVKRPLKPALSAKKPVAKPEKSAKPLKSTKQSPLVTVHKKSSLKVGAKIPPKATSKVVLKKDAPKKESDKKKIVEKGRLSKKAPLTAKTSASAKSVPLQKGKTQHSSKSAVSNKTKVSSTKPSSSAPSNKGGMKNKISERIQNSVQKKSAQVVVKALPVDAGKKVAKIESVKDEKLSKMTKTPVTSASLSGKNQKGAKLDKQDRNGKSVKIEKIEKIEKKLDKVEKVEKVGKKSDRYGAVIDVAGLEKETSIVQKKSKKEEIVESLNEEVAALNEDYSFDDIFRMIKSIEFFQNDSDECLEKGCDNPATTFGYCRLHYIASWKDIKKKQAKLGEGHLQEMIEGLVSKFPMKYLKAILSDLVDDKSFFNTLKELDIESNDSFDDLELEDDDVDIAFATKTMKGFDDPEEEI